MWGLPQLLSPGVLYMPPPLVSLVGVMKTWGEEVRRELRMYKLKQWGGKGKDTQGRLGNFAPQKISYHDLLGHPRSSLFNKLISSSTNILKGQKIHSSSCCEKKIKKLGSKVQMLHISVETCDKRCRKSFSWYYLTVYVASVQPTPELCRCRML